MGVVTFIATFILAEPGIMFHLSEVIGPVSDQLKNSDLLEQLTGNVYLTNYQAWMSLTKK